MSVEDYLQTLNLQALRRAKVTIGKLLEEREGEAKVLLWQVSNGDQVLMCFAENDYAKAVEWLTEIAKSYDGDLGVEAFDKILGISYIKVPESEVKNYLSDYS